VASTEPYRSLTGKSFGGSDKQNPRSYLRRSVLRTESIPTKAKEQEETPDYYIYIGQQKIVYEIKQINPNEDELEQQRLFEGGGLVVSGGTPGARVRNKITAGAGQIRIRAKGKYPSILVLYNNVLIADHTNSYFIQVAMYGLETHVLAVPKDATISPYLTDKKFGPKRKMSKDNNTSISAVGVIFHNAEGIATLRVYHNVYAEIPLSTELLRQFNIRQFTLTEKLVGQFPEWKEI